MNRRKLLSILVQGGGLLTAGLLAIPSLVTGLSPVLKRKPNPAWQSVGAMDDFELGKVQKAIVNPEPVGGLLPTAVYVWHVAAGEVVVFSRTCTDLGCPVNYDPGSECYFCPCHGGIFAKDGERMAGPPNRPLYRYDVRVVDGTLQIDLNSVPLVA